jgi:hypothetical protein
MRKIATISVLLAAGAMLTASLANAHAYRRPQDSATPGAPVQSHQLAPQSGVNFSWNGLEAPAYSYGYALNTPSDGNWRWIEPRCYSTSNGNQTCVEGHWLRRSAGRCEEVTAHSVRRGNYIRVVPAGTVSTCRR